MKSEKLLRHILMGLPIAAAPVGGLVLITNLGCLCGSCPPTSETEVTLTENQRAALPADGVGFQGVDCDQLCRPGFFPDLGAADAGPNDAAMADAGARLDAGPFSQTQTTCTVEGLTLNCSQVIQCIGGRAPSGWMPSRAKGSVVGRFFADMAHLETAAIPAFAELSNELRLHRAPAKLQRISRRSQNDELSHARLIGSLAARFGAHVPAVRRTETAPRSLFELAKDNAAEGCVREAYGAILAAFQAQASADAEVRRAYTQIARDEARHALLSIEIDAWARSKLSAREEREIDEVRDAARAKFVSDAETDSSLMHFAGMPNATRAHDLMALIA